MGEAKISQPAFVINSAQSSDVMTVCVLGAPRGGTSAVAGIVRNLGIPMGQDIDDASNEDLEFRSHAGDRSIFGSGRVDGRGRQFLTSVGEIIDARNRSNRIWGWKDPISAEYISDVHQKLRNPHFVIVFRDIAAISQREAAAENESGGGRFLAYSLNAQSLYGRAIRFISETGYPDIAVSYERFLRYPSEGSQSIAKFLGFSGKDVADAGEFARSYIKADRRTASLSLKSDEFSNSHNFRASNGGPDEEAQSTFSKLSPGSLKELGDVAYLSAADALNASNFSLAEERIRAIFDIYSWKHPIILGSDAEILSHLCLSSHGADSGLPFPDQICGGFFMLGLLRLMSGRYEAAYVKFLISDKAILSRLSCVSQSDETSISRSIYWDCLLHLAKGAVEIGRDDVVSMVSVRLRDGRSWSDDRMGGFGGWVKFDRCISRFESEVAVKP